MGGSRCQFASCQMRPLTCWGIDGGHFPANERTVTISQAEAANLSPRATRMFSLQRWAPRPRVLVNHIGIEVGVAAAPEVEIWTVPMHLKMGVRNLCPSAGICTHNLLVSQT